MAGAPAESLFNRRNRYRACLDIKVEPKFKDWDGKGSLIDFIISKNLHRRHLNESQKGACARDALPFLREEAKARQQLSKGRGKKGSEKIHNLNGTNGRATEHAANLFGTNWRYVSDAEKIANENPEYFEKIKSGELSIPEAKKQIKREEIFSQAENY